jgi:LAO/AO transport system kinase
VREPTDTELAAAVAAGDPAALARAISIAETDFERAWGLIRELGTTGTEPSPVVGLTGPPGAGKSTLVAELTRVARERDERVAVLSVDPSSPFSGGAVLGDRVRLGDHFRDGGVFIRSMASRGALGGLADAALQSILILRYAGFGLVCLETVGVGQSELDVIDHVDTVVLVLTPTVGDSVQALKAGIMEIPDVVVVNRSQHPDTDQMVRDLKMALALSPPRDGWRAPIVRTEAIASEGIEELVEAIESHRVHLAEDGGGRRPRPGERAVGVAVRYARRDLEALAAEPDGIAILAGVERGEVDIGAAAWDLYRRFMDG